MEHQNNHTDPLLLPPGQGRVYNCGTMTATFKADENETGEKYSVSEWWLQPQSGGPGAHQHENVDMFYVLEGTMSFLVGDKWVDGHKGTFLRIPGNTMHTFENRTGERAGMLNLKIPGGFEREMPAIVKWFEDQK